MDNTIYLCLITIVIMQLLSSGETYSVNRKKNSYLDNEVNKLNADNNDIFETLWKRLIHQGRETSQQEKKAREAADEEIEELLNSFKAAKGFDLNGINGYLNRQNKRNRWWLCPWCQTSKAFDFFVSLLNCKCNTGTPVTCKCPDGSVLTENGR